MLSKPKYYEKKLHKLSKRLKRLEKCPQRFSNYDHLHDLVVMKINSCTAVSRGNG